MKIIDAHLHLFSNASPRPEQMAQAVGHHNSTDHLREAYSQLGMVHGVVMGNTSLELDYHRYPEDLFHYCIGLDSSLLSAGTPLSRIPEVVEAHLQRKDCCGVKLYPGYNKTPLTDPMYEPVYALAAQYGKPVAVHMGLTSFPHAHLKYCHPLALDEVAADHKRVNFVMCHFGNPFFESSAAVLSKNPNVSADLSGLLEGLVDLDRYFQEQEGYLFLLKTWMTASCAWEKLMYGTDWPIVNLGEYLRFVQRLVPEAHWDKVFFENANRIYGLGL